MFSILYNPIQELSHRARDEHKQQRLRGIQCIRLPRVDAEHYSQMLAYEVSTCRYNSSSDTDSCIMLASAWVSPVWRRRPTALLRDVGVGILGARGFGQKETRLEPEFLFRCAGTAGGAVGACVHPCGLGALLRGLEWMVCGTRKGCEGAWLRWLIIVVEDVAICEQGGLSWIIDAYPQHECLDECDIHALLQKEQAGLRVMHWRVCVGVRKDEPEQFGAIVQTAYIFLKVLQFFIAGVRTDCEAAV